MVNYLVDKGIAKEQVPHAHSPQSNPAERQLQTLFRRILVIKLAAQLPNWLWDELADAVNHVDAVLPVRDNPGGASPMAMITGTRPSAASFKVLGCLCFVHTPSSSLDAKVYQGTVVGYARDSIGLRVLVAGVNFRSKRAIIESNSVICHEGIRGINGTSFDSNIIITTTDGFDDFGTWDRRLISGEPVLSVPTVLCDENTTPVAGADASVEGSIPSGSDFSVTLPSPGSTSSHLTTTEDGPDAILLDEHLTDRDLDDVLDAAYKGNYMGTRSRHTGPFLAQTDASTFDFHANVVSTTGGIPKYRNGKPKQQLAATVKGGVHSSIHRSVTGTHRILSKDRRFDAIGGKHSKLSKAMEDPRCAEAWKKEISGLLENGNLVMMDISEVPKGYRAIGYAAAFKHKFKL